MTTILFVCTGNAARSVMGAAMLRAALSDALPEALDDQVEITSAGTHSIPGLPMSTRTRAALGEFSIIDRDHLSAQLEPDMVDKASVVVIFEPMHLSYMRKKHAEATARVVSLPRFARDLEPGDLDSFATRLAHLNLEQCEFEPWEEVIDPAGGDLAVFQASAAEIHGHIATLAPKLGAV